MNRIDVLDILCDLRQDAALIISPGLSNYTIAAHGDLPLTIYNMDMPYATPIALGAALGWPARRIVSVEEMVPCWPARVSWPRSRVIARII